jgi:hypothetical protein
MVLCKLGLPSTLTQSVGQLWDSAIHLIKMIYGTSTVTYTSDANMPLYGPGQGSMCGPLFWLLCYWLIVESIDPTITITKYISTCHSVLVEIMGVSFFDDTGLGVTSNYKWNPLLDQNGNIRQEILQVVQQLKTLAQQWKRLLFSTGGAINFQKSFWYLPTWN